MSRHGGEGAAVIILTIITGVFAIVIGPPMLWAGGRVIDWLDPIVHWWFHYWGF